MRRKMILSHIAVLLLFCLITFTFVLRTIFEMEQQSAINTGSQIMSQSAQSLSTIMTFGRSYALDLCTYDRLQQALQSSSDSASTVGEAVGSTDDSSLFYKNTVTINNIPYMLQLTQLRQDGKYHLVYSSGRQNQTISDSIVLSEEFAEALENRKGHFYWDSYSDDSNEYLRLSKTIYDKENYGRTIGSISFEFSYQHIAQNVLDPLRTGYNINAVLVNGNTGEVIGYRTASLPDNISELLETETNGPINGGRDYLYICKLENSGFYLVGVQSFSDIQQLYMQSGLRLLYVAFGALAVGIILSIFLSHTFTRPITELSDTMRGIRNGDLDVKVHTGATGEIAELYDSFNYMLTIINQLIDENYVTKLNQKQSELKALQSQINTHFLYNTLDSINWLALDHNVPDISYLVTNLSTLLRTSLSNGRSEIPLADEIKHVTSYINIQQVRFGELFRVEYRVDRTLNEDIVVKTILQPLAENAILHSFNVNGKDKADNLLIICAEKLADSLRLTVSSSAPEAALEAANRQLQSDAEEQPRSYGIPSIRKRLELTYNGEAEFKYSWSDNMLSAVITIPRKYTMLQ